MGDGGRGFDELRRELVEANFADGQPLATVTAEIEAAPVDDDAKAALWLFAWALERQPRRSVTAG
jgi:hypothetical protein